MSRAAAGRSLASPDETSTVTTGRLESFSDGVIAVAATLLVLNIVVPDPATHPHLAHALGEQWPVYAAYAVSFVTIGIIWINHQAMISRLRIADHAILIANLLLLMSIALLPFATSLIATYLKEGHGQKLAAAIYAGSLLVMSLSFTALNALILLKRSHMLKEDLDFEQRRFILRRTATGLLPYAIATALAAVTPYATLIICGAVAVFYALPIAAAF